MTESPFNMDNNYLIVKNRDCLLRVPIENIVYFEADGNFTIIVTINNLKKSVYITLGRMEQILVEKSKEHPNSFIRIGRNLIVNTQYLFFIDTIKKEIILSDCANFAFKLNCSKEALKKIKEVLTDCK